MGFGGLNRMLRKINILFSLIAVLFVAACSSAPDVPPTDTILEETPTPSPATTLAPTATQTPLPTPTFTLTPQPTPTWTTYEQGQPIEAPILLYHKIIDDEPVSRYNVYPADFTQQMQALKDWGYTPIPISMLEGVIRKGGKLPPRPIVITFDDGHLNVFQNAFPVMQQHGFIGVTYIVANRFEADGFTGVNELNEMIAAGWEIGSHTYTHPDLTLNHPIANFEVKQSRFDIAKRLDIDVRTFAYPFGKFDEVIAGKVFDAGYKAAMGLGRSWIHTPDTRFYLSRIEIHGGWTIEQFAAVLPWH
jgi:peptidoglycan/xylan/chitin deacetylase (PgdA/CDA1 family)